MNIRNASVYAAVVAAGCVLVLASFYPGYMSADSLDQLGQARQGMLNDHHSPVMTMLWAFLDRLWPGPQGIVLFHNVCFWSGTAILCGLAFRRMTFAILATFSMGLAPPIFALLGTAWKDVGFGCSLLLAVALLALAERTGRPRWILASVPLLFYAISVRHDGIVGVFPVCLWAGTLFARANLRARFPGWYRTGAGAIAGRPYSGRSSSPTWRSIEW
jgi:urea transporter